MTNRPQIGKTRHRWLLGDLDANLTGSQTVISRLIAEIRQQQERSRPSFQDIAMLVAELAQMLSGARTLTQEMIDLIEQAHDGEPSATEQIAQQIAEIQNQIDAINRRLDHESTAT